MRNHPILTLFLLGLGLIVLGPVLLVLLGGAIALSLQLAKFALVALVVFAVIKLVSGHRAAPAVSGGPVERIAPLEDPFEAERRAEKARLDRELEKAILEKGGLKKD